MALVKSRALGLAALLLSLNCAVHAHRVNLEASRDELGTSAGETAASGPEPEKLTHRGNSEPAVIAETLWSVRVLKSAITPNNVLPDQWANWWKPGETGMDLLWAYIQALQKNDKSGIPFRVDPPFDDPKNDVANKRNQEGEQGRSFKGDEGFGWFLTAFFDDHKFKNGVDAQGRQVFGMDFYINSRVDDSLMGRGPNGELFSLLKRFEQNRSHTHFVQRGRVGVPQQHRPTLQRMESTVNTNAGIAPLEAIPNEARNFFPLPVVHGGKNGNMREDMLPGRQDNPTNKLFRELQAPFIGGASGSIEYLILSMEDDCKGSCPDGLVPWKSRLIREALIGIFSALLIAGGQHSLTECLLVAQTMGYFRDIPLFSNNYELAAASFELYMTGLGFGAGKKGGPLRDLADARQS